MKKSKIISYYTLDHWKDLPSDEVQLVNKAKVVCSDAYAPYSKFKVGAALLMESGEIIVGSNQENVAYPSGLCAERVAIFSASANYPDEKILKIAIISDGDLIKKEDILSPCGACRQVMAEVQMKQDANLKVILINPDESVLYFEKVDDLLPFIFGK